MVHLPKFRVRIPRRIRRFFKNRKLKKLLVESREVQKYSQIWMMAVVNPRPVDSISKDPGLVQAFWTFLINGWYAFLKVGAEFVKKPLRFVRGLLNKYPWLSSYVTYTICLLLVFKYCTETYGTDLKRKLTRLELFILALIALSIIVLFFVLLEREWVKKIIALLVKLLTQAYKYCINPDRELGSPGKVSGTLTSTVSSLNDEVIKPKSIKPKGSDNFVTFLFYVVLTTITTKVAFDLFKKKVTQDHPMIEIILNYMRDADDTWILGGLA